MQRIGALYAVEAGIAGKPAEVRRTVRQAESLPLLASLRSWLEAQRRHLSAKSAPAKAIDYALARWDGLTLHVDDGRLAIDNNPAERALRGIAVTRKSFLFLGSETGGERAAILYTVLETAKLNGLDPEAWLADILTRMAAGHPVNRLNELLPWNGLRSPATLAA